MKKFLFSIFLFITIIDVFGQNVNITTAFDSSRIYIGDQIKFIVTYDKPSDLKLNFPVFKDTLCKNIEIISGPHTDSSTIRDGRIKVIQKYLITSFDSGHYKVKPVYAETKSSAGLKRFYSDYASLQVMRVKIAPPDTTAKIFDIVKPYKAPVTMAEVLPWVLILAVLGIITWATIRYFKRHKKLVSGSEPYIPPDPAHIIAFRELEILKNEELWQKGEVKKYYTRLTEILRQYLENRFRVFSLELTTSETLEALLKTGFKKNGSYNELRSVLTGADLVKFAKYKPEPTENEAHFQSSWNFVDLTREADLVQESANESERKEGAV